MVDINLMIALEDYLRPADPGYKPSVCEAAFIERLVENACFLPEEEDEAREIVERLIRITEGAGKDGWGDGTTNSLIRSIVKVAEMVGECKALKATKAVVASGGCL